MDVDTKQALEISIIEDPRDFGAMEEEWDDLYRGAPLCTPFQSWAWLYSWWEFYGEGYELRLVTVRDGEGLLVGLIPLMLKRRWGLGRLLFVGTHRGMTPYKDVLVREGWEEGVFAAARDALKRLGGWQVADLQYLRPEAAAWGIFPLWDAPKARLWQENYLLINVKPWEELLMSVDRKLRSNARRTIRRAEADGVRRRLVGPEGAEGAARRLVALHRELWQGRGIDPERLTGRYESHIAAAASRMTARGLGSIYEFSRDGDVIISGFMVFGREFDGTYMEGATKEALQRYQWNSLVRWYTTDIAHGRNSAYVSLMDGEQPYKLRWAPERVVSYRMVLGRGLASWFPHAGYRALLAARRRGRLARRRFRALRARVFG